MTVTGLFLIDFIVSLVFWKVYVDLYDLAGHTRISGFMSTITTICIGIGATIACRAMFGNN